MISTGVIKKKYYKTISRRSKGISYVHCGLFQKFFCYLILKNRGGKISKLRFSWTNRSPESELIKKVNDVKEGDFVKVKHTPKLEIIELGS